MVSKIVCHPDSYQRERKAIRHNHFEERRTDLMETRLSMTRSEIEDLVKTIDDLPDMDDLGEPEEEVIIDAEGAE